MLRRIDWYVIGIYLFLLIGGSILTIMLNQLYGLDVVTALVNINVIGFPLAAMIILWMMRGALRQEKLTQPLSFGHWIGWSALGLIMAWGAQILATVIETGLLGINPVSENTQLIVEISRMNPIFIVVPALVGPILEELVFRKILFGAFYRKMGFIAAALLSSAIFSIAHTELKHFFTYAAMGLVFSYLYVKTGRIIVPIIVHMAMNTIAVLGQLFIDPEYFEQIQTQFILFLTGG